MTKPGVHPADLEPSVLAEQCAQRRVRRSGPGGQRRNKVETGVVLEHRATGLKVEASERRSPADNRREALRRLRSSLAIEVRVSRPASAVPSALWKSRLTGGRIAIDPKHEHFPSLLAEALDVLEMENADVRRAASRLDCTPSQFVKLLKREPRALARVNEERVRRDLGPLK